MCFHRSHRKKSIKKKRNASLISVFVLLILKTRRRKVGHQNFNCPDGIEKKTLRPSLPFCALPSKLLAQMKPVPVNLFFFFCFRYES